MRVAICWHSLSGYMAACWRALAATPGIELLVVTQRPDPNGQTPFDPALVAGVRTELVAPAVLNRRDGILDIVIAHNPDVIVLNGWFIPAVAALAFEPRLAAARRLMAIDRPTVGLVRDTVRRVLYRAVLKRMHLIMVAGDRSRTLALNLGFPDARIRAGTYGVDYDAFSPAYERRLAAPGGWPRSFVFTGRYAPEKGIHELMEGYTRYRAGVRDPWPLVCCGKGPLDPLVSATPGVVNRGFVQPTDQPALLESQGVSLLVSRFEPWGVVVAEAAASGLPLICSTQVCAAVELLQPYFNGLSCPPRDAGAIARSLRWMHEHAADLPAMGMRSRQFAAACSAQMWARRWCEAFDELAGPNARSPAGTGEPAKMNIRG